MNRGLVARFALAVWMGLSVLPISSAAQTQAEVQYIPDQELTSDRLITALKGGRGIHIVPDSYCQESPQSPDTSVLTGVSDFVAIHVHFASNSAVLAPDASRSLNKLGEALKSNQLQVYRFQIAGHTDSQGNEAYNCQLSQRRAQSVVRYLGTRFGIQLDRLLATGYGEAQPIADNETSDGRRKNRRVQIVNVGKPQ